MNAQKLVVAVMTLFGGCTTAQESELVLAASGSVRYGRFVSVDGGSLASASNRLGEVVRARPDDALRRYHPSLAPDRDLALPFTYSDERSVISIALDADASVAALTFEREYEGDIDEATRTQLTMFDLDGKRRWSVELARDTSSADYESVVLGPTQVYVASREGRLRAYDKESGALAWQGRIDGSLNVKIAADPTGGVTIASGSTLEDLDPRGAVRWSTTAEALGAGGIALVARAPDGAIAVLTHDGALDIGSTQQVVMLEAVGTKRWSMPLGARFSDRVSSIATDGTRIVAAGDYTGTPGFDPSAPVAPDTDGFVVTVPSSGERTSQIIHGAGTQRAYVTSMAAASSVIRATSFGSDLVPSLVIDGVHAEGEGVALLDLAR